MRRFAAPLEAAGVDTIVLGCPRPRWIPAPSCGTSYRAANMTLHYFSAEEAAREVAETLKRKRIDNDPAREGTYRFLTTGDTTTFREMGPRFLQLPMKR